MKLGWRAAWKGLHQMSVTDNQDMFESAFWHFTGAIRKLASNSEQQCPNDASFETPWEMRENYFAGLAASLGAQAKPFNDQQLLALDALGELLRKLPIEAISPPNLPPGTSLGCSIAMGHPSWIAVRSHAANIICLLDPLIRKNRAYFERND
jgi:hypothetical protein